MAALPPCDPKTDPPAASTVALVRCPDYARANVELAVGEALRLLGGIARFVRPGSRVLLKPNLITGLPPQAAATTHPEVVAAVARAALAAGGRVTLGDSPGVVPLPVAVERSGIAPVLAELGIPLDEFSESVEVPRPSGARFRKLQLARAALEADAVLNLAKVKTHQQMFLTLAVKNNFGCVAGRQKALWHLSAGRDPAFFARVLVEICLAVRPALSIADGVLGMEGTGPTHGLPRPLGWIAASADPFTLDAVLTWLLGFRPEDVPVLLAAQEARSDGLPVGETRLDRIRIVGDPAGDLRVTDFRPPAAGRLLFLPDALASLARRLVTVKPVIDRAACRACGVCVGSCPAQAMKMVDGHVRIDDTLCIRCFCCQELCPHGAVRVRQGWLSKLCSR